MVSLDRGLEASETSQSYSLVQLEQPCSVMLSLRAWQVA